jgi:hypothetical protein
VTDKLWSLSEGEPLLLRLYVEDLWHRGPEAERLKVEELDRIKPGLAGYFDDWLARQRQAWRSERKDGEEIDEETLSAYLAVFACAYGPLAADELRAMVRHAYRINTNLRIEDALHPLRRFVIGTGKRLSGEDSGYVLSHPKLGEFLREDYFDADQVGQTRRGFATGATKFWCNSVHPSGLPRRSPTIFYSTIASILLTLVPRQKTSWAWSKRAGFAHGRHLKAAIRGFRAMFDEPHLRSESSGTDQAHWPHHSYDARLS